MGNMYSLLGDRVASRNLQQLSIVTTIAIYRLRRSLQRRAADSLRQYCTGRWPRIRQGTGEFLSSPSRFAHEEFGESWRPLQIHLYKSDASAGNTANIASNSAIWYTWVSLAGAGTELVRLPSSPPITTNTLRRLDWIAVVYWVRHVPRSSFSSELSLNLANKIYNALVLL